MMMSCEPVSGEEQRRHVRRGNHGGLAPCKPVAETDALRLRRGDRTRVRTPDQHRRCGNPIQNDGETGAQCEMKDTYEWWTKEDDVCTSLPSCTTSRITITCGKGHPQPLIARREMQIWRDSAMVSAARRRHSSMFVHNTRMSRPEFRKSRGTSESHGAHSKVGRDHRKSRLTVRGGSRESCTNVVHLVQHSTNVFPIVENHESS